MKKMEGEGYYRDKFIFVSFFFVLVLVSDQGISAVNKQTIPAEKYQLSNYERGFCNNPGTLPASLQQNITSMKEILQSELEEKIKQISEMMKKLLEEQMNCFAEKEKQIRESLTCEQTTTAAPNFNFLDYEDESNIPMCETNNCKDISSKMLDSISHSADPCEDFYEYACGGVEDDPHLLAENVELESIKILQEKLEEQNEKNPILGSARTFYDACLASSLNQQDSLMYAKDVINSIGKFLALNTSPTDSSDPISKPSNLTYMLANFMKSDFTPFFDIILEPDASDTTMFVPTISLVGEERKLSREMDHFTCITQFQRNVTRVIGGNIDLNKQYQNYLTCKKTTGLDHKVTRMGRAISEMGLLDHVISVEEKQEILEKTKQKTKNILSVINEKLPSRTEIQATRLNRHFQVNQLHSLNSLLDGQIDWEEFFYILSEKKLEPDQKIILYHQKELSEILAIIANEWTTDPIGVHNSLLMLWSERVYSDLVSPLEPTKHYCIDAAKQLLPDIASDIYLHFFPDNQVSRMQRDINKTVKKFKETFKEMIIGTPDEVEPIREKIDLVKVNVGAFLDAPSRNDSLMEGLRGMKLNSSHAYNMDFLLKRHRRFIYSLLDKATDTPRFMWINGVVPYATKGFFVHEWNTMYLPVGILTAPYFYHRKRLPDYIMYGGLGNVIAKLFLQLVDGTGVNFNGKGKVKLNVPSDLIIASEKMGEIMSSNFELHDTTFTASYKMPLIQGYKLDNLLTNSGSVRLSWMTYLTAIQESEGTLPPLTTESPEELLIWIGKTPLNPAKAFFIRIAQTQCTSSKEIDLLHIMENKELIPRHRINLSLKNEKLFSEAFQCSSHAAMNPTVKFPFLKIHQ